MAEHVHLAEVPEWEADYRQATRISVSFGGDAPAETTILIDGRAKADTLARLPHLKAVVVPWAGVPPETREAVRAVPGLKLYNLHHNAADTAEMAIALLFAAARRLPLLDAGLKANNWTPKFRHKLRWQVDNDGESATQDDRLLAMRLSGKQAVVLGYGAIGQHIGRVLEATGMTVHGINSKNVDALDARLAVSHVLIIALPLTPETQGMIDARRLGLMPSGSLVVNIGRGAIIVEEDLYRALESGHLGGAGLDVWWQYPQRDADRTSAPPSRFPFGSLPNVVMSPHVGGGSDVSESERMHALLDLVAALTAGETVKSVSLERGY